MSVEARIDLVAALTSGPAIPSRRTSFLQTMSLFERRALAAGSDDDVYDQAIVGRTSIDAPVIPFTLPIEQITKVKLLIFRASTPVEIRITSAVGADQVVKVKELRWRSVAAGDEVTAIKILGTCDAEYVVAGS